jgi:hypothetical protein
LHGRAPSGRIRKGAILTYARWYVVKSYERIWRGF